MTVRYSQFLQMDPLDQADNVLDLWTQWGDEGFWSTPAIRSFRVRAGHVARGRGITTDQLIDELRNGGLA